ncbi:MAG: efflux RND transporter periplasmic adaptor subunit [Deltaproteobacteria bacterium]
MKQFFKKHKKKIIIGIIVLLIGALTYNFFFRGKSKAASNFAQFKVVKKDIAVTISGGGTVASSYRQEISSKVDGTVTKLNFKEGDKVKKGDLMIELDNQDIVKEVERTRLSIKQAQSDLESAQKNISDLSEKAPIKGQVINFTVKKGDQINKGAEICTINDNTQLLAVLPFTSNQAKKLSAGQKAEVYLQDYMQAVEGKVTYVDKLGRAVEGGGKVYDVEIIIKNPGTIAEGIKVSARINGQMSMDSSALEYVNSRKVKADVSGTVIGVEIKNNQTVSEGQVLFKMENSDLYDQLLSAQIKMADLQVQLNSKLEAQENYKVYAPVTGTIVTQDIKVGDNVETKADKLAVVADYTQMEFQIDVDELDIAKISVGMEVNVTIDALENQTFKGEVAKVANEGTSTNGVATYPVIIKISDPQNIKGGMNANAEIVIQKKEGVLALPESAIQKMGRRSFVYTKKKAGEKNVDTSVFKQNQPFGQMAGSTSKSSSSSTASRKSSNSKAGTSSITKNMTSDMTIKIIETGITADDYIEITSGLSEGDIVYIPVTKSSTNSRNSMMPMGGGPMDGGGPPSGFRNRNDSGSKTGGGTSGSK